MDVPGLLLLPGQILHYCTKKCARRHRVCFVPLQKLCLCSSGYPHAKCIKQDVLLFPQPKAMGLGNFLCQSIVLGIRLAAWASPKPSSITFNFEQSFDICESVQKTNILQMYSSLYVLTAPANSMYFKGTFIRINLVHAVSLEDVMTLLKRGHKITVCRVVSLITVIKMWKKSTSLV